MKIGKETIKGLVQKNTAGGLRYYWEPTPKQRAAGWKTLTLPNDLSAAISAAKKRNEELESWKFGGASPRAITRYTKAATFGALLTRYEQEKQAKLSANSRRVDQTQINRLREWAGDQPVRWITRARVKALRDAFCPGGEGTPGHGVAFKLLAKGRDIFAWAVDEEITDHNPFERFGLAKPPPRDQIWLTEDIDQFCTSADALGWHSIGFALRLGAYTGQREADIIGLTKSDWREITLRQLRLDHELHAQLASDHGTDAGKVMGVRVRQSKTKVWVGSPIEGTMRDEVEAAIQAAQMRAQEDKALTRVTLVAHDKTGRPWHQRDFIDKFAEVRTHAIEAATKAGDAEQVSRLAELQYRDLRRTCVVTLGELGLDDAAISAITGHKLATIKSILEVYMPRTEAMAARAVVARLPSATEKSEFRLGKSRNARFPKKVKAANPLG